MSSDSQSLAVRTIDALTKVNKLLLSNFDLDTILQQVVDELFGQLIQFDDRYKITVLSLLNEEKTELRRTSVSLTESARAALETLNISFKDIRFPMTAVDNIGVRSILENRELSTNSFFDVLGPALSEEAARNAQAAGGVVSSFVFPVIAGEEAIGSLIFSMSKPISDVDSFEIELMRSFVVTVGISISNAKLFKKINLYREELEGNTEQLRKQNQSLEIAMNRLERLRQQEQDMLDVLGHELRTPITIVRNALAVLKMDFEPDKLIDPERLGPYIEKALESTKREMVLIETLLAATKIDANRIQLNLDKADLDDVIRDSIDGQELVAKERRIEVIYHKPENMVAEEWQIYVDRTRIQEIQDNFLNNAVKYTLKGKVEIFIEKLKVKDTDMIKVSLKDTGIGIPQEDIPKLGRKFFRARQYIKENDIGAIVRPGGTGLGLYVSFELVKIMDGEVKVESVIGEGSTFSYTIPLYNGQAPKHIDQTFGTDQELEEQLLKRRERDQSKLANQAQEDVEIEKRLGQTPAIVLEDFKKVSSANDIISQINATRKIMENKSS